MKIGISTGFFYGHNILDAVKIFKDTGFDLLEVFAAPRSDFEYVHFNWHDKSVVSTLLQALKDNGMSVSSVHAPFGNAIDVSAPDESIRQRSVSEISACMDIAKQLNAGFLVIHPASAPAAISELEKRFSQSRRSLEELYRKALEIGIRIAVENQLPHILGGNPETLYALLEGFSDKASCFCFDSSHANLYPEKNVAATFASMASRIKTMHISDNGGSADEHLAPGSGTIYWPDFVQALKNNKYDGVFMLEVIEQKNGTSPIEVLNSTKRNVENLLK